MLTMLTSNADFVWDSLRNFAGSTGIAGFFSEMGWGSVAMICVAFFLLYLAIRHKFEPLLLFTIAFGMLLTNLPGANLYHTELFADGHVHWDIFVANAGLLDYLYLGVKLGIYPCLIFVGVGAMTDFGPLIANPKSFLLGAAAQIGIFATFLGAYALGFTPAQAGSIGIIGGADGPTAIYLTSMLAPELLGPIAVAAYSYMALVPVIQPPIMRALTNKKERGIKMRTLRPVSKLERILFPLIIAVIISLLLPSAAPLIGCLMLGNLMKECGVVDRLSKTVQNELMNIVVIFLGLTVGATATAEAFLNFRTLGILVLGVVAFAMGTAGGLLLAKLMNVFSKDGNKINPLIGSAGVSAVPMAARVSQTEGQKENPSNYLLMHAMGPNVAGVVGSAVAAGILLYYAGGVKCRPRQGRAPVFGARLFCEWSCRVFAGSRRRSSAPVGTPSPGSPAPVTLSLFMPFFFVAGCVLLDNSAIFLYLYEKSDPLVSGEKTLTMKKWCVWLLALCVSQGAAAQDSEAGECVFHTGLEQYPTFMGGDLTEFRAWVYRNIRYPREAFDRGEQGRILVSFVIDTLGNVTQVEPSLYGIRSSFFVFSSGLIPEL